MRSFFDGYPCKFCTFIAKIYNTPEKPIVVAPHWSPPKNFFVTSQKFFMESSTHYQSVIANSSNILGYIALFTTITYFSHNNFWVSGENTTMISISDIIIEVPSKLIPFEQRTFNRTWVTSVSAEHR